MNTVNDIITQPVLQDQCVGLRLTPFGTSQGLKENILWLSVLQGINYILPLATVPYLIRVLGSTNYGVLAFATVFTQYLVVFADYGFNLSATREIAIQKDNPERVERLVSAVLVVKFALVIIAAIALLAITSLFPMFHALRIVFYITFLVVLGSAAFPVWLFQGLQDMRTITVLTSVGKVICAAAIFITVSNPGSLQAAALWSSAGYPIAAILAWIVIGNRYRLRLTVPARSDLRRVLNDGFHVFVSSVMTNVLANGSVLVLGMCQPMEVVGTYAAIEKIAKAATMMFAPITQSLYPRTSERFAIGYDHGRRFVVRTGTLVVLLAVAVSIIVAGFGPVLVSVFCGSVYKIHSDILRILAAWLLLGVVNNVLGIQFLLGSGRSKAYSLAFTVSTVITVVLLLQWCRVSPYIGTASAVTIGELTLTLLMAACICVQEKSAA